MERLGAWPGAGCGDDDEERRRAPRAVHGEVSPEAFMEELCATLGGYGRFLRTLTLHYFGWWAAVVAVPAAFLDHHRCEGTQPWLAWIFYGAVVAAMLALAVLLEASVVQRLGLLEDGELLSVWREARWRLPLLGTLLWKLDAYTDVVFIFLARDCGSSLWWASLATFAFGVGLGQLLFNVGFACTDCDHELPASFGFILLDFKLVNSAVRQALPFDPDASHLPVAKPVTLRTTAHLVSTEKIVGDIAQACIQLFFLGSARYAHGFVVFSVVVGILHSALSLVQVFRDCVYEAQSEEGAALKLEATPPKTIQLSTRGPPTQRCSASPSSSPKSGGGASSGGAPGRLGACDVPPELLGRPASESPLAGSKSGGSDRRPDLGPESDDDDGPSLL